MKTGELVINDKPKKSVDSSKNVKKWKIWGILMLVFGVIALVVGVVFLVIRNIDAGKKADGDYLVTAENWTLSGEDGVIWDFTEIGKGKLTTNNHINDYDFEWAIDGDKLIIKTDWLYELNNEYTYSLDQGSGILTLTDDNDSYEFKIAN